MGYHLPMLQAPKHSPPSWEPIQPFDPKTAQTWLLLIFLSLLRQVNDTCSGARGISCESFGPRKRRPKSMVNFFGWTKYCFFSRAGWGRNVFLQKDVKIQSGSVVCFHQRFNDALVMFLTFWFEKQMNKSGRDMDQTPHSKHPIHKHKWGASTRFREKKTTMVSTRMNLYERTSPKKYIYIFLNDLPGAQKDMFFSGTLAFLLSDFQR